MIMDRDGVMWLASRPAVLILFAVGAFWLWVLVVAWLLGVL